MSIKARFILAVQGILTLLVTLAPWLDGTFSNFSLIPSNLFQYIGVILGCIGLGFCALAMKSLGKSFTIHAVPNNSGILVTSGVFKLTRNPMYLGGLLMALSWAFYFSCMLAGYCVIALGISLYVKVLFEENQLSQKFGEQFQQYRRKTKRLVPFLF